MTTPTIPSPAEIPRAGISLPELLRRQEQAHDAADALLAGEPAVDPSLLAPPGELERLAAEQGVHPIESIDELGPPAGTFTEAEAEAFHAALRGDRGEPQPRPAFPVPQPPPVQPQRPLAREQYIRRLCLQYAIQYFTGLTESDEHQLFAAAKDWASWIQHG